MMERDDLIKDAFPDDPASASVRDRVWRALERRRTRQARLRQLRNASLMLVTAVVVAAVFTGNAIRTVAERHMAGPDPVPADSILSAQLDSLSPGEAAMTQEQAPSNLIPLLGHRSSLQIDISNFEGRRDDLLRRLNMTTGREHDMIAGELEQVERSLEAARIAMRVVDARLSGHAVIEPIPVIEAVPPQPAPVFQMGSPFPTEYVYAAGGAGAMLVMGMMVLLLYMRRIARTTREALAAIEGQVSSQHATLASGIDAIAVEVERLGEGQRYMSKMLTGTEAKVLKTP
jgi:hypothetical protein